MDGGLAGHDGLGAAGLTCVRGAGGLGVGAAGGQHGLSADGLLRGRDHTALAWARPAAKAWTRPIFTT